MSNPNHPHDDPQRPDPFIDISWSGKIRKKKHRRSAQNYQPSLDSPPGITTHSSARKITAIPKSNPYATPEVQPQQYAGPGSREPQQRQQDHPRSPLQKPAQRGAQRPAPRKGTKNGLSVLWSFIVVIVFIVMAAKGVLGDSDDEPSDAESNEWSQEPEDSDWSGVDDVRQEYFDENAQNAKPADETQTVDDWDVTIEKVTFDMDEFFTENQYSDRPFEDNIAVIVRAENLSSATRDFNSNIGISDPAHEFPFDGLCPEQPKDRVPVYDVAAGDEILFSSCIPATADDLDDATIWAGTYYSDENRVSWELPDDLFDELAENEK